MVCDRIRKQCSKIFLLHTEFIIGETLRNFYASFNCDFKVHIKDKPGNYEILFHVLADVTDRYASRVILYVTLPINPLGANPEKWSNKLKHLFEYVWPFYEFGA